MEFNLIQTYFQWRTDDSSILIPSGDDCSVISSTTPLAISTDTLNEGVHFFSGTSASDIAHKAFMVNLSDLAAMGGVPKYIMLNLSLPSIEHAWLTLFSQTLKALCSKYHISLIGGDTTKGALSITITIFGEVTHPLTRSGAVVGDGVFVSGKLGGAARALERLKTHQSLTPELYRAFHTPTAKVALGQELSSIATSCIDISDGLAGDLGHILRSSGVGADICSAHLPLYNSGTTIEHALYGGEDYELCFTAPIAAVSHISDITHIGIINSSKILTLDGTPITPKGFEHF